MSRTITVNVEENVESEFRRIAGRRYGRRKGYLGKAVTEAMKEWSDKRNDDVVSQGLELLKKGIAGKKWTFNRAELYER
ncbi:MAG: hypothetical protein KGI04_00615 [Candidatus Micrarchaeota archaeon]|nr:hypothetical protein [Candidatus Micrarchaeota archaeon]